MNSTIRCTHCGKDIQLSDALAHELKEETERIRKTTELETRKKLQDEFESKEKAQAQALEKEKRELTEKFEKQKEENERKVREEAAKEASEKHRLEKLEYEKKINDMQKALEEAQRKGKQGSQQLQGEVLELDLETQLKANFQMDKFSPIPKGIEGGDIWQQVVDRKGNLIGSILWETKRAKAWDKKWLQKLRQDTARVNASECILISEVLPQGIKVFDRIDRVWISNYEYALHVARIVRFLLLNVAEARSTASHTEEDLRRIFEYITSDGYKHKINAHYDTVKIMREELDSEIRLTQVRWKRREAQIKNLSINISQLEGDIQGIIESLPNKITIAIGAGSRPSEQEPKNENED